jgi:Flp pilus assembly protein CpaB
MRIVHSAFGVLVVVFLASCAARDSGPAADSAAMGVAPAPAAVPGMDSLVRDSIRVDSMRTDSIIQDSLPRGNAAGTGSGPVQGPSRPATTKPGESKPSAPKKP